MQKLIGIASLFGLLLLNSWTTAFAACADPTGSGCSCEAMYYLDNAHNIHTGWKQLSSVKLPGVVEIKCKNNAIANCQLAKEKLLEYAPIGTINFKAICAQGGLGVDFDSRVQSHSNDRYGNCHVAVSCRKSPVVCNCPRGWVANITNIDGGVTTDGKCKRAACGPITISPLPANGTPIGSWGFSWDNNLIAWGTAANGGAPTCTGGEWVSYN